MSIRKTILHPPKGMGHQLDLFSNSCPPMEGTQGRTLKGLTAGDEMVSSLDMQRTLTENLLGKILEYGNLTKAYAQIKANQGSAGVDGMSIDSLREWLSLHMDELREALLREEYEVSTLRKVEIPKGTGGKRLLGIPTVKDRFIQQAIHQVLSVYYDPLFSENSYGFRPGRSAHQAIDQASSYIASGYEWVVDLDLANFFDKINHDRLMQRLSKGLGDQRLLRLIHGYLKAGVMEGGLVGQRVAGTPQGGPLSPLLSNIVLDELDKELERRGHKFCRYADDCNVYVKSKKAGERVLQSLVNFIEGKLKLEVNRSKSGVRPCSEVNFLGYTVLPGGHIRVSDKSLDRLKVKIREITRRNRGNSFHQVVKELNTVIIGWTNYFRLTNRWLGVLRELDGWIRRRLRCYKLKQAGRRYTLYKLLRGRGIAKNTSWNVVMYSQGWWAMSHKLAVCQAFDKAWFSAQGLQSLHVRVTGK